MSCTAFNKLLPVQGTASCSQRIIKLTIGGISCFQSSMLTWLLRDCTSVEAIITDFRTRPPGKDHWCKPSSIRLWYFRRKNLWMCKEKNKEPGECCWYHFHTHCWLSLIRNSPLLFQTSTSQVRVEIIMLTTITMRELHERKKNQNKTLCSWKWNATAEWLSPNILAGQPGHKEPGEHSDVPERQFINSIAFVKWQQIIWVCINLKLRKLNC